MSSSSWARSRWHMWANLHLVSLELSARVCEGCQLPLVQALVLADPDITSHPCCGPSGPIRDWTRWRHQQQVAERMAHRG